MVIKGERRAFAEQPGDEANAPRAERLSALRSNPADAVIAGIIDMIPWSAWMFARIEPYGGLSQLHDARASGREKAALADELARQRAVAVRGPRIAASLGSRSATTTSVTMIFADVRADYGILMMTRDASLAPFSSVEISILTFALEAGSDRFAALRLQPERPEGDERPGARDAFPHEESFYVLDDDMEIVLAGTAEHERRPALTGIEEGRAQRLPPILEASVRELTSAWSTGGPRSSGAARPVSFLYLRTQPMSGKAGQFVGVRIDRCRPGNSLTAAAMRFHITPREVQVLSSLLDGDQLDQIAHRLHITSSTVQDHIRSLLDKTESRNRSELIARVLGWNSRA